MFFFSSRRRHTRSLRDWSSDVCSSDLAIACDKYPTTTDEEFLSVQIVCPDGRPECPPIANGSSILEIGRASCRERVEISAGALPIRSKCGYAWYTYANFHYSG